MADKETCSWTDKDRKEIRQHILQCIIDGMHLSKRSIWTEVHSKWPTSADSTFDTIRVFNNIYYSVQKEIRENTDVEKSLIVQKAIENYEDLMQKAIDSKNWALAKSIQDSLVKLVGVDKVQQMLKEDKDGNLEFHLDFGL